MKWPRGQDNQKEKHTSAGWVP